MQEAAFKIYDASAGSGKTFTLVSAYLKIVLASPSNKSFRKILAITFTNKAVNEMKQRILTSLFEFGQDPTPQGSKDMFQMICKELQTDPKTLQERAKGLLKEILHNYAFFDVSTIDKFTYRLLRTFAKDLKLPQNFEVVLDTDLLLDEAVARLVHRAGTDVQLTKLLIDFALEKIAEDKSWDPTPDLIKIGKLLFNENHVPHVKAMDNKGLTDFAALKKILLAKMNQAGEKAVEKCKAVLDIIQEHGLEADDFPRETLPNHFKKIIAREFDPAKLYNNKLEQNLREGNILKSGVALPSDQITPKILDLYLSVKEQLYHRAFLKNSYQNVLPLTVLNAIQQEVNTLIKERNQLPISSFNTIISNEIRNQPAPFIYERLGEKYRHYFIDEFQDTSEMQWKNLIPLISNALESENEQGQKGSLLLVGDAKQAIYRWRGGKAEQFLNLINLYINPFVIPPKLASLPTNYRSSREIVEFNNDFFSRTSPFLNNEIYNRMFLEGNQQKFNTSEGGLVQLTFLEKKENALDESYAHEVLKTIQEVRAKGYAYKDICILTRKRKHGILLAAALAHEGIPLISSETLLLLSSPKIKFLISLLKYCDQPKDRATAYAILYFLAEKDGQGHTFIQRHLGNLREMLLGEYGFDLDYLKRSAVYDGLEYAIKLFQLGEGSDAYLTYLMDTVLEVEQKEGTGLQLFLSYWDKKKDSLSIVAPQNIDAVQIMTIHKAKGLEFPVVIFPFANSFIYEEIAPKLWVTVRSDFFAGFKEVLINKKQEVIGYGEKVGELFHEEQHKLELDAFNILYVALTRAKKALFIISEEHLDRSGQPNTRYYSGLFIHYLQDIKHWEDQKKTYAFGVLNENPGPHTAGAQKKNIPYSYSFKDRPSFNILSKAGLLWDTQREQALSQGNLMHALLGQIETKKDIGPAFEHFLQNGDITADELDVLKSKVLQVIDHPQLKVYYQEGNVIKNEQDIITKNGLILRPDRVMIQQDIATVIDYKTGERNSSYGQQLHQYGDALKAMGYAIENLIIVYINDTIVPEFI